MTIRERPETVTISISHRDGIAICAVTAGNVMLGCDLELVETRSTAFIADYFTKTEQELIAQRWWENATAARQSAMEREGKRPKGVARWTSRRHPKR